MIDTDKYEGHTPAPWYERKHYDTEAPSVAAGEHDILLAICGKGLKHHSSPQYAITRPVEEQEANAKLIADAPLLLAEVKRLREGIKKQIEFTLECIGSDIGDLYETIADDLRRLIE